MSSVACNLHRLLLSLILNSSKRKNLTFVGWGFCLKHEEPDDYLLSHGSSALSSAWSRFTVLFGMGSGGTDSLWSSGMTCCCVVWDGTTNLGRSRSVWVVTVGTRLHSTNANTLVIGSSLTGN